MRSFECVVGISPSIVDKHYFFVSHSDWQMSRETAGLEEGTDYIEVPALDDEARSMLERNAISTGFKAGSSILAAMAVLPVSLKLASKLYTTAAMNAAGEDTASRLFREQAAAYGISTVAAPVIGSNPVVHILVEPEEGVRCFVKEIGVSKDLVVDKTVSLDRPAGILLVDAYELNGGRTEATLVEAIRSARGRVAMSLGDVVVLAGHAKDKIVGFDAQGLVGAFFGNTNEYRALLDQADGSSAGFLLDEADKRLHADIYITDGASGMYAAVDGQKYFQAAEYVAQGEIASTAGAGDAAIGIILGSIALGEPISTALRSAVEHCAHVVQSQDDIIVRNW